MVKSEYGNVQQLNNTAVYVYIDADSMTAYMCLPAPVDEKHEYSYDEVKEAIDKAGVKMGVINERIHEALLKKQYDRNIIIAKGKPVEHGEDGKYELFFDTDISGKPKVKADGSVDYFNIKLFELVKKDDKLAEYIPNTRGEFGYDVKGKLLVPKPGRSKPPLRGKGFYVSEDGNTYYASIDGKVEYRNTDLNVLNVLEITGDVDLNIGNIDFSGDVNISGNVISGVTINAMGDVYIGGYVEGAYIYSDKDIVFADGVNGKGNGKIEAKGNIRARFLENVTVVSKGDISADYILNSNVMAYGKINISGKRGGIHGGDVSGVLGVEAAIIGNSSYSPTTVRVGALKQMRDEYADIMAQLREVTAQIDTFNLIIEKYDKLKTIKPEKFDAVSYRKVLQSKIVKNSQKTKYEMQARELYSILQEAQRAVVRVDKDIYPGTNIYINGLKYQPESQLVHVEICAVEEKIHARDY